MGDNCESALSKVIVADASVVNAVDERSGTLRMVVDVNQLRVAPYSVYLGAHANVRGIDWYIAVRRTEPTTEEEDDAYALYLEEEGDEPMDKTVYLEIYLWIDARCLPTDRSFVHCTSKFRLLSKFASVASDNVQGGYRDKFTKMANRRGLIKFMSLAQIADPANGFAVDGRVTVEIDVDVEEPHLFDDERDFAHHRNVTFDHMIFTDMKVRLEGGEETIDCHKAIVCRHSKVVFTAMSTADSREAQSGVFEIGHDSATAATVRQFVTAMYDEWDKNTMDEHGIALLLLAHCYESDRVSRMAYRALKRYDQTKITSNPPRPCSLLTAASFWTTLDTAVRIDAEELTAACVDYAIECGVWSLLNCEEGKEMMMSKENKCGSVLMLKIGEKQTNK